jgi:hypothetical protein
MTKHPERRARKPAVARVVAGLAPEALHQLIVDRGIGDCAEMVAAASPAQLAAVFDLDLWRSPRPGEDARFDADRFGDWLELLIDAGDEVAARIVAAMDLPLVVAGLSRYIRVIDPAALAPIVEGEVLHDMGMPSTGGPECEVGGYLMRGLTGDSWDAIVALLIALEAGHAERFHAVMGECRRLSNSRPEVDGLDSLLIPAEQLLHDLALDRDDRRSERGYSTAADARAFLLQARRRPRPTPPGASAALVAASPSPLALVRTLIEFVRDHDDTVYLTRSEELAFLANTLVAGCSIQSRAFTPREASNAAVAICNLGLEQLGAALPAAFLMDHALVTAFEMGWAVLHEDVSMFTAAQLARALSNLQCSDAAIQEELDVLRRELTARHAAGTPWVTGGALDPIGMLDMPAWAALSGLLDECPVIHAALTATLEARTGAISPTDFTFISTTSQLGTVRDFMSRFLDIVSR